MTRLVLEHACAEHGEYHRHRLCGDDLHLVKDDCWCPGGERRVLDPYTKLELYSWTGPRVFTVSDVLEALEEVQ